MQTRVLSIRFTVFIAAFTAGLAGAFELTPPEETFLEARNNTLRVAFHGNYIPLSYVGDDGRLTGIMPEFFRWMAQRAGFEIEHSIVTEKQAAEGLSNGMYDAVGVAISAGNRRAEQKQLSLPVMKETVGIFVPAGSPLKSRADLSGTTVAYEGDAAGQVLDRLNLNVSKKKHFHFGAVLDAVESGRCSAMIYSQLPVLSYMHCGKTSEAFRMLGEPLSTNQVCIRVADETLLPLLNRLIAESQQDGAIRWIKRPFLGEDFVPYGSVVEQYGRWLAYGTAALLLLVLLFWLWDVRLTRCVHEKTQQLRSSEERLSTVFQNSPDPIFIEN
jgi:polar amino acid transport system substrate-binding protein